MAPRFRRLNIEDAKVGDAVRFEGVTTTITSIERSPDSYHWRVHFARQVSRTSYFPAGCVFTQPPEDTDHDAVRLERWLKNQYTAGRIDRPEFYAGIAAAHAEMSTLNNARRCICGACTTVRNEH